MPQSDAARFSLTLPGPEDRCEIHAGQGTLAALPTLLADAERVYRYVVVSDETVAGLWADHVLDLLGDAGIDAELLTFPPGEASKTPGTWAALVEAMAGAGLGRDGAVVALGGGVTGDMAGFAAASYARGIPLVQIPTSLLAMIDAAIGGKTGLDLRAGKNLVGAFHQPALVVADPVFLDTLPDDELRMGLAEAVKHGAIANADYFDWLARSGTAILGRDAPTLDRLLEGSIRVKTQHVVQDVREGGVRAMLNFGHTIGHALERLSGYAIPHGRAVAIGMVAEAGIGEALGVTADGTADRLSEVLAALDLPVAPPATFEPGPDAVIEAARTDKKTRRDVPRYSLIARIGAPARTPDGRWTHAAPDGDVATRALEAAWARR